MRNFDLNSIETSFSIKNSLYGFIITTYMEYGIQEEIANAGPGDWKKLKERIYRVIADFFDVDEVTNIIPDGNDNQVVFFKEKNLSSKLPKEGFSSFSNRVNHEIKDAVEKLINAIKTKQSENDVQKYMIDVIIALCADKTLLGEFGEKYYTSNHYMIPNRLEAIICDVRKRMNNYTDIVTKDIDSKTLIDIICTVMYKYDAEPCEPYLDARTLEDKGKPCYATGRCRNKHCTCPLYKPDEE